MGLKQYYSSSRSGKQSTEYLSSHKALKGIVEVGPSQYGDHDVSKVFKSSGEGKFKTSDTVVKSSSVEDKQKADIGIYMQNAIHENVNYSRKGQKDVPAELLHAIKFIIDVYNVPSADKFDISSEYGPLNNITYEERLYRAYFLGKFTVKEGKNERANLSICGLCGSFGHYSRDCEGKVEPI